MYLMRIQELGTNKVRVVTAKGRIETIIHQLALLKIHVVNYVLYESKTDAIQLTKV